MRPRSEGSRACQACQKRHVACSWPAGPTTDGVSCARCSRLKLECSVSLGNPVSCLACRRCHHRCVRVPGSTRCERCKRLGISSCEESAQLSLSSRRSDQSSTWTRAVKLPNDSFTRRGSILLSRTTSEALSHNGQERLRAIDYSLPNLLGNVFEAYVSGNKSAEAAVMILCMAGFKFNNAVEHRGASRIVPIDEITISSWLGGRLPKAQSQSENYDHLASRVGQILKEQATGGIASQDLPRILSVLRLFLKFKCNRDPTGDTFRHLLTTVVLETVVHLDRDLNGFTMDANDLKSSAIQLAAHEAEAAILSAKPSLIIPKAYDRLMSHHFESSLALTDLLPRNGTSRDASRLTALCNTVKELLQPCGRDILRIQRRLTLCWASSYSSVEVLSECFTQAAVVGCILDRLRQSLLHCLPSAVHQRGEASEITRTLRSVCCIEVCWVHTLVLAIMTGQRLAKMEPPLLKDGVQPYDLDQWRMAAVTRLTRVVSTLIDYSTSLADYFHILDLVTQTVRPDPSLWSAMIQSIPTSERTALIQTLHAASFWDPGAITFVDILASKVER